MGMDIGPVVAGTAGQGAKQQQQTRAAFGTAKPGDGGGDPASGSDSGDSSSSSGSEDEFFVAKAGADTASAGGGPRAGGAIGALQRKPSRQGNAREDSIKALIRNVGAQHSLDAGLGGASDGDEGSGSDAADPIDFLDAGAVAMVAQRGKGREHLEAAALRLSRQHAERRRLAARRAPLAERDGVMETEDGLLAVRDLEQETADADKLAALRHGVTDADILESHKEVGTADGVLKAGERAAGALHKRRRAASDASSDSDTGRGGGRAGRGAPGGRGGSAQAPGSQFRAKKAGGDIQRGRVEPYAYVPLRPGSMNKRKRKKASTELTGIVKAAERGGQLGRKHRQAKAKRQRR